MKQPIAHPARFYVIKASEQSFEDSIGCEKNSYQCLRSALRRWICNLGLKSIHTATRRDPGKLVSSVRFAALQYSVSATSKDRRNVQIAGQEQKGT
jgi:hypothetical protein